MIAGYGLGLLWLSASFDSKAGPFCSKISLYLQLTNGPVMLVHLSTAMLLPS